MLIRYIINAIIIVLFSQKLVANKFFITKKKTFIKNMMCVLFFEECISIILNLIIKNNNTKNFIDVLVLIITFLFFYILSISCYYIHEFRGTNLNFQDLMSIPTAKEVAGGYIIKILPRFVYIGICYVIITVLSCYIYKIGIYNIFFRLIDNNYNKFMFVYLFSKLFLFLALELFSSASLLIKIISLLITIFYLRNKISSTPYNYGLFAGEKEGYIYNFFSSIPFFHKKVVYDNEENIYNEYIANKKIYIEKYKNNIENDKPYVICIMNESFGTSHRLIKTNIDVTLYYDNLKNVVKGNMYVNTIGGGTCNTEYDFLTYSNVGDFEYPIYPFNNLVKKEMYALPHFFREKGYNTVAFHPYTKTNYNRHKVYERFGFDEFLGIEDMDNKKNIRSFISDECMYEKIIDRLNENIKNNNKLFLYGVSIQNHGGYNFFFGEDVKSEDERFCETETINSYLSLMKKSDDAIKMLVESIKKIDERVVLLFFGDHNATYDTFINKAIYGEDDIYEMTSAYRVPFFIYDNKNKNKNDKFIEYISPNFLATELVKIAGLNFDYDLYCMDKFHEEIECMNYHRMMKKNEIGSVIINNINYKILQKHFVLDGKNRLLK